MSSNPGGMPSQIPKQRVLLVDDSRIVRTTISRLIRKSFDVREEANGEAGWQAITTDPSIVVVFSDLQMPVLDGFALLERIRQSEDPRVRGIPVIVISGDEEDATKKRARAAGANDFITKTTDGTEILSRIDNLLHLVEAKQQLVVNKEALDQTATRDPVTGAFTPHYLATEGGKHYSHARRHGGPLAVLTFRMDSYGEIAGKVGKTVADQLLAKVAKLVMGTLREQLVGHGFPDFPGDFAVAVHAKGQDSYGEIAGKVGKTVADQLLAKVAKLDGHAARGGFHGAHCRGDLHGDFPRN